MADPFKPAWEALQQTADGLVTAVNGIKKLADAMVVASQEYEDVRETVQRVETELLRQSDEMRALRTEVRELRDRLS